MQFSDLKFCPLCNLQARQSRSGEISKESYFGVDHIYYHRASFAKFITAASILSILPWAKLCYFLYIFSDVCHILLIFNTMCGYYKMLNNRYKKCDFALHWTLHGFLITQRVHNFIVYSSTLPYAKSQFLEYSERKRMRTGQYKFWPANAWQVSTRFQIFKVHFEVLQFQLTLLNAPV